MNTQLQQNLERLQKLMVEVQSLLDSIRDEASELEWDAITNSPHGVEVGHKLLARQRRRSMLVKSIHVIRCSVEVLTMSREN